MVVMRLAVVSYHGDCFICKSVFVVSGYRWPLYSLPSIINIICWHSAELLGN